MRYESIKCIRQQESHISDRRVYKIRRRNDRPALPPGQFKDQSRISSIRWLAILVESGNIGGPPALEPMQTASARADALAGTFGGRCQWPTTNAVVPVLFGYDLALQRRGAARSLQ